jgi:hypothetical protein
MTTTNNTAFGVTDIEAEFIARPADLGEESDRLTEHCRCVLCQKYYEAGWNIHYFNHTVCKSCIVGSGASDRWSNWTKTVCDVCRKSDVLCFHDQASPVSGNTWHICRECLVKGAKHYAKYEPDGSYFTLMDQYRAYLKQF